MKCRHAKNTDLDKVCDILTTAFYNEPVHVVIFPDDQTRYELLWRFFRLYVELAMERGGIILAENNAGALVYFRPGGMEMTPEDAASFDSKIREVCGVNYETAAALITGLDNYHPQTPPHYYISLLAVQPSERGGKVVTALFNELNSILNKNKFPCYAECTRYSTRTLIRRWGYHDSGAPLHVEGFNDLYPVWREPQ
ncbi:hypothetical protein [Erwinia sp. V71]|uniref:hypothetical protein n=1 Tax=Erwinia sp. V71 TaxID=3369424 RepID=UPI003F602312